MQPETLVKLVGSGNTSTVEEEWLRLLESPELIPAKLQSYAPVLAELAKVGKTQQAEELATMALEALADKNDPEQVVKMASAFLLAIGDSATLRKHVTEIFRSAYSDRDQLEELIKATGLIGGRPVRRALRALDVCLSLQEGDYLTARDDETAARVEKIDRPTWTFGISDGHEIEEMDAVTLADRYRKAAPTEFAVIKHFTPDQLVSRLQQDPAAFILDMCLQRGGKVDSVELERLLVPGVFSSDEFEKWWSKARTAVRKRSSLKLEGRSPYYISYQDVPDGGDDQIATEFRRLRDPRAQLELVEKYVKEAKSKGTAVSQELLRSFYEDFRAQAQRSTDKSIVPATIMWLLVWRLGQLVGENQIPEALIRHLATAKDLVAIFQKIEDEKLVAMACDALVAARTDWPDHLLNLLPHLPTGVCDDAVDRLIKAGRSISELREVVQKILSLPIESFEALLWLWDGPKNSEILEGVSPVTVLTRILRALDDCRRDDRVPRPLAKKLANRARSVLGGRRYERFVALVKNIDRGMAIALRSQIAPLENLGRSVPEDMLNILSRAFPVRDQQPVVPPWQREDVLYVTQQGMTRKQAEIDHHVNVKMRDNARAIGAAAEHGDLSENSEYKFALEERDLLRARLGQMNAEMASAKVITPADVPLDHVAIGTKVIFRRVEDGAPYEMTFVGPWEADHTKAWFNYRAPMAQGILGKRVGDIVDFEHGEVSGQYRIAEIHNGIEHMEMKAFETHDYTPAPRPDHAHS